LNKYVIINSIHHMTLTKYFDYFSAQNNNIVVFISKLSQLTNISLPSNIVINLKNKSFQEILTKKNHIELLKVANNNLTYKIIIKICNPRKDNFVLIGSEIYDYFDYKIDRKITFIFSKSLYSIKNSLISDIILGYQLKTYSFDKYLNKKISRPDVLFLQKQKNNTMKEIKYNDNLLKSISFSKDLVSEPANILNPVTYAARCKNLRIKGLKIKILNFDQIQKIGMNSLLGVSQGSVNEPQVVIFEWNLKKNKKPIILVGKGVTFDSGGISLKPSTGMEEMIFDMGGSAVVVGSMMNAALNKLNKSIVGIIGLVENMPDGKAQRPGDIVESLSGQTIEIINTDAEGRLVLADIITYVQKKYKPLNIIDFATLTGAIMVALGTHKAGLFSNNDKLSKRLQSAGEFVNENVWRLPLGTEYDSEINSSRADMKNIGSTRYGGSIQAAQFIKRFIKDDIPWAHLDIAGVTWSTQGGQNYISKIHKPGATAFGVRLIDKFLKGN